MYSRRVSIPARASWYLPITQAPSPHLGRSHLATTRHVVPSLNSRMCSGVSRIPTISPRTSQAKTTGRLQIFPEANLDIRTTFQWSAMTASPCCAMLEGFLRLRLMAQSRGCTAEVGCQLACSSGEASVALQCSELATPCWSFTATNFDCECSNGIPFTSRREHVPLAEARGTRTVAMNVFRAC